MRKKFKYISHMIAFVLALVGICSYLCSCHDTSHKDIVHGVDNQSEPKMRVALTFDDGPHETRTARIVDELSKYGFHATFFIVGNRIDGSDYKGAEALRYAYEAGNEIGVHGYTHRYYYDVCAECIYKSELSMTAAAIKKQIDGYDVRLMRPIGGKITEQRVAVCPYAVITWDVDSEDWKYRYDPWDSETEKAAKVNKIVELIMSSVEDGSIILMHDIYESTYDVVKIILPLLCERGYEVVTVSELLGNDIAVGKKYSSK